MIAAFASLAGNRTAAKLFPIKHREGIEQRRGLVGLLIHQQWLHFFPPVLIGGVMLRQAREEAGVTQEALAKITKTKKSAISRLENHAEDVRLSTVGRVARALGKVVRIELVEAT